MERLRIASNIVMALVAVAILYFAGWCGCQFVNSFLHETKINEFIWSIGLFASALFGILLVLSGFWLTRTWIEWTLSSPSEKNEG